MWADESGYSGQNMSLTINCVTAFFTVEFNHEEIKRQDLSWSFESL